MLINKDEQKAEVERIVKHCIDISKKINLQRPTQKEAIELINLCSRVEEREGFLYFFLLFVWMPHPTKDKVHMLYDSYGWQRMFAYNVLRFKQFIWSKPRQTASTSMALVYFLWRSLFFENQDISIFSLTQRDSRDVLTRIEFVYQHLPAWLRTPTKENQKTAKRFTNNSRLRSLPSGKNVGRGVSGSAILLDEFAFWDHASVALAAIVPGLSMGFMTAWTNKTLPSQLFLISTKPLEDGGNNEYMRILREARERALASDYSDEDYYVVDVDTSDIPEYNDPVWHKKMKTTLGDKKYRIEILNEDPDMFLEDSFLSPDVLQWIQSTTVNPIRCDFLKPTDVDENGVPLHFASILHMKRDYDPEYNYIKGLWIFDDPKPNHQYGMMCDIASAGGGANGDKSTFHVFDLETMEQVAEYQNKVSLPTFEAIIETVMVYFGSNNHSENIKFCTESTGLGMQIAETMGEKYPENFYFHRYNKKKYLPGFPLGTNRPNVLAVFEATLEKKEIIIRSIRTMHELRTFGWKNGKAQALNGAHDDLVMPLAEFCYLREIFFKSTNQLLQTSEEEVDEAEKLLDLKRSKNFQFGNKTVELRGDALSLYEDGFAIPMSWLSEMEDDSRIYLD